MLDNVLLLTSVIKYFETEQSAIALSDGDFKLLWFNKSFKELFKNKKGEMLKLINQIEEKNAEIENLINSN